MATVRTKVFGQSVRTISIKEAIDLSIANSKQLKNSYARIEEATAALREAVQNRLPAVSVSGSYLRLNNPHINLKTKTGSSVGSGDSTQSSANPSSALYGIANVSLPIYSGLKIKYGIESSKYLAEAARLDAGNDREAVILNTIQAYDNLYKSKAAVDLVKENLESNRQRVHDFSNLEKNGLMARNDLLKVQLQESNTELSLLDAENNWKLANINMNLMLGMPDSTVLGVNENDLQPASVQLKGVGDYVQLGLLNRKDVSALSYRQKAANTAVKIAKGAIYPSIALTGGYVAANIPNVLTVTNAMNIGVGVRYNLNLGKNNSQVQQAKAREKQLVANQEMLADEIQLEISQAYQNYLLSQKKIEVYNNAVAQAEENYKIVKNKFDNALATTTDLLDADVAQLQARLNAAFSKADASVAYNKLLQTAGLLDNTQVNK
ncbi:MAG: TolC family protein [Segetibacter sp.]